MISYQACIFYELRRYHYRTLLAVVLAQLLFSGLVSGEDKGITLRLRSEVRVQKLLITLADVASFSGSNETLKRQVGAIDLCQLKMNEQTTLTREFIQLRLALGSRSTESVRFTGARQVLIKTSVHEPDVLHGIEIEIEDTIAEHVGYDGDDLRIRFLRPLKDVFGTSLPQSKSLRPEVVLPTGSLLGRSTIDVRLLQDRNVILSRAVPIEVSIKQTELRVMQSIKRHVPIELHHVRTETNFVTSSQNQLSLKDVLGRVSRRNLNAGDQIKRSDIESLKVPREQEYVVRPRDAIRLIAYQNHLKFVVPSAEVMQSGRIGQVIRVRNLQSNRIVNARVVSADEAVVDLQ